MLLSVASVISGRIMARTGPRIPMITGLAIGGAGLLGWGLTVAFVDCRRRAAT